MILSSSILRFLAFASLAVPAASNSIRGSSPETQELDTTIVERDLLSVPPPGTPNVGLGQMVCSENSDSSVSCTFRVVVPPSDRSSTLLFDCMTGSRGNVCLSTQVSRVPFQQVPNQGIVAIVPEAQPDVSQPGTIVNVTPTQPPEIPQTPLDMPPDDPPGPIIPDDAVVTTPNSNPNPTGTCPATRPLTGFGCGQSLSSGSQRTVCLYDDFRCTCSAQNTPLAWNCYRVMAPEQEPVTPVPEPMTPVPEPEIPVTVPPADDNPPQVMTMPPAANDPPTIVTPPNTGLDVNVNNANLEPSRKPWLTWQSGNTLPIINNNPLCPGTTPVNVPCDIPFNIKCTYYSGPPDAPTGARDCVCMKKEKQFLCKRTSTIPGISF